MLRPRLVWSSSAAARSELVIASVVIARAEPTGHKVWYTRCGSMCAYSGGSGSGGHILARRDMT